MMTSQTETQLYLTVVLYYLVSIATTPSLAYITGLEQCEPIKIPRCRAMPYDMTLMPNFVHHSSQDTARLVFETFEFILDQHCSDVLLFLLCSIYVPICPVSLQPENIPPCRSVCQKARTGCEPLLTSYNVTWPSSMECSAFPEYERGVCITPEAFVRPKKKRGCRCKKRRPSLRNFTKYKYNFAFHFKVQKRKRLNREEIAYRGKVLEVIFSNKRIKLTENSDVTIYSNTSRCSCAHKLRKGHDYVIMGHRSRDATKFTLIRNTAVDKWKKTWPMRIKKWRSRIRARILRQKRQKKFGQDRFNSRRKHSQDPNLRPVAEGGGLLSNALPITDFVDGYTHGGRFYPKSGSKKGYSKKNRSM